LQQPHGEVTVRVRKLKLDDLVLDPQNARKHSERDVNAVAASLKQFGQQTPIVVTSDMLVVKGNGTTMAAMQLGWTELRGVVTELTGDELKAYAIADNQTGLLADWDWDRLAEQVDLLEEDVRAALGFDQSEIDELLERLVPDVDDTFEDGVPPVPKKPKSKLGQVWAMGPHRLLVGDCLSEEHVNALFAGEPSEADMVFTDPPYNVAYESGGKTITNDDMSDADFAAWLLQVMSVIASRLSAGGACYVCHSDSYGHLFRDAFIQSGIMLKQCLIWVKQSLVLGRNDYQWRHEPILYGFKGGCRHRWYGKRNKDTILLDQGDGVTVEDVESDEGEAAVQLTFSFQGRTLKIEAPYFDVVSDGPPETVWKIDRPRKSPDHPTQKPIELCARAIKNSSKAGQIVFDPFGGSGSTLIACDQLERRCFTAELDPGYADVILKRWEQMTGGKPELVTG
jgi:DNA modification methylase